MQKAAFTILVVLLMACKDDTTPPAFIGTWKLVNYCMPSGTSTCSPVIVPSDKGVYIELMENKEFGEHYKNTFPTEYAFLGCGSGNYEIEGKSIRIRAGCMSSSNGLLVEIVSLTDKRLVLKPFGTGEYVFEKE